jgi:hypothetical protein
MPTFVRGDAQVTHMSKKGRKVTQTYHTRKAASNSVRALRKLGVKVTIGNFLGQSRKLIRTWKRNNGGTY